MGTNNLQELKDAAVELMRFTCNSCEQRFCEEDVEEEDGQRVPSPCGVIIRMRNALSANPIRNCNVGTAEEQEERFKHYCGQHYSACDVDAECFRCPLSSEKTACEFAWAQLPYEERGDHA